MSSILERGEDEPESQYRRRMKNAAEAAHRNAGRASSIRYGYTKAPSIDFGDAIARLKAFLGDNDD